MNKKNNKIEIECNNDFKNVIKEIILKKRKDIGFIDKDIDYSDKEMFDLTCEYEVYRNLVRHISNRTFNEAMLSYENENKHNNEFTRNYMKYKYMLKTIYDKYYNDMWTPNQIVIYLKAQMREIKKREVFS